MTIKNGILIAHNVDYHKITPLVVRHLYEVVDMTRNLEVIFDILAYFFQWLICSVKDLQG